MSPELKARFRIDLKTVIAAVSLAVAGASFIARSVAQAEIEPVRLDLATHKSGQEKETGALVDRLDRMDKRARRQNEKLDALCRAIPNARCPLGEE